MRALGFRCGVVIACAALAVSTAVSVGGTSRPIEERQNRSSEIEPRVDLRLKPGGMPLIVELLKGGRHDWGRLHMRIEGAIPAGDWRLEILDRWGGHLQTVAANEFLRASVTPSRYETEPLFEDVVQLGVSPDGPEIAVVGIEREVGDLTVETTCGLLVLRSVLAESGAIRQAAKGVGLLEYSVDGEHVDRCNAALVAKKVVMTNDHCIAQDAAFHDSFPPRVYFSFESIDNPGQPVFVTRYLGGDPSLDLSLLELAESPPGANVLSFAAGPPAKGDGLRLVQHYPQPGWRKRVSMDRDCQVFENRVAGRFGKPDVDILHGCDTDPGSSGAPVLDFEGRVVGLHHWGKCPNAYNQAARGDLIEKIVNDLRNQFPDAFLR